MTIEFFEESNSGTRTLPRSLATKAGALDNTGEKHGQHHD